MANVIPSRYIVAFLCSSILFSVGCAPKPFQSDGDESAEVVGPMYPAAASVRSIEYLHTQVFPTGTTFKESEIGGISAIVYDSETERYHLLSDDRSVNGPARFFTATIDHGELQKGGDSIQFTDVTTLKRAEGKPFPKHSVDPEGMVLLEDGDFYISSEGDAKRSIAPFVNRFSPEGTQIDQLPLDQKYHPQKQSGIRNNLAFESLTLTPDHNTLVTGTENGLIQDGPAADLETPTYARIIFYDLPSAKVSAEYGYRVEPVPLAPIIAGQLRTNGLVELLAVDNDGTFLALERAFSVGRGNSVKLFEISSSQAQDIQHIKSLADQVGKLLIPEEALVSKTELLDFGRDLNIVPDNLEAMCWGPLFADGSRLLVLVSDNNFNVHQETQFIFLKVLLQP